MEKQRYFGMTDQQRVAKMSNYHTMLSFNIEMPSNADAHEALELLCKIENLPDTGVEPGEKRMFKPFEEWDYECGLLMTVEENHLWVQDDGGCANVEFLGEFLKLVVQRIMPTASLGFEWANTCDRPIAGSFGGGMGFITASEARLVNTEDVLQQMRETHDANLLALDVKPAPTPVAIGEG